MKVALGTNILVYPEGLSAPRIRNGGNQTECTDKIALLFQPILGYESATATPSLNHGRSKPRLSNINVVEDNDLHIGIEFAGNIVKQREKPMHRRSVFII